MVAQQRAGQEVEEADGVGVLDAASDTTALPRGGALVTLHARSAPGSVWWFSHFLPTPPRPAYLS